MGRSREYYLFNLRAVAAITRQEFFLREIEPCDAIPMRKRMRFRYRCH